MLLQRIHFARPESQSDEYAKVYHADGTLRYAGMWRGNLAHGCGQQRWEGTGRLMYVGMFHHGLRNGKGRMLRADGTLQYDGLWEDGAYHGIGTEYNADGVTVHYVGEWWRGLPVLAAPASTTTDATTDETPPKVVAPEVEECGTAVGKKRRASIIS